MGTMYRLKAYFGMVPAEEMDDYADETGDRYAEPRRTVREFADERWEDRFDRRPRLDPDDRIDVDDEPAADRFDGWGHRPAREPAGPPARLATAPERPRETARGGGFGASPVRGALAMDPDAGLREAPRPVERVPVPPPVPEQRDRGASALSTITTLQPRSYNEARTIGERYREGVPVIMNLTELDDAAAKRLVDFAAGLAFALRGSIDKVTNRVFLLTPADVEVSADDARKLAERGIFRQD